MSLKYTNTNKNRAFFKKVRIGLKIFVAAVMAPVAAINLANAPVSGYIIEKASRLYGIGTIPYLNYFIGSMIVLGLAGLCSRKLSSISAYFLGVISFVMAVTQYHLFGAELHAVVTDGAVIVRSSQTDHGAAFTLLALASAASLFAVLLSVRRNFFNVQRRIARM